MEKTPKQERGERGEIEKMIETLCAAKRQKLDEQIYQIFGPGEAGKDNWRLARNSALKKTEGESYKLIDASNPLAPEEIRALEIVQKGYEIDRQEENVFRALARLREDN